jgi:hypothetical protein
VDYKDEDALRRECEEGRRLGFDGKVCTPRLYVSYYSSTDLYSKQYILHRSTSSIQRTHPRKLQFVKLPECKSRSK